MLSHLKRFELKSVFIAAIFLGIVVLTLRVFRGDLTLEDPFHHGEYFAATAGLFLDANLPFHPLTIHGALDYIPGLFSEYYWGADNYFLPTFAIYKVFNFVAAIILILIAYELTALKSRQWLFLLAAIIAAPLLVGYRDLVLLISLYLFLRLAKHDSRHGSSVILQIFFGAIVAFGIFWSYDRGIAGALSLGAAVLVLLTRDRWYAISLAAFGITVIGLGMFFEVFAFRNYIGDIYILMQTSSGWSYGWQRGPVILTAFAVVLNVLTVSLLIAEVVKSKEVVERLPVIVCFSFLSVFMLKMGVNRADLGHIYFSCWLPMLIAFYLHERIVFSRVEVVSVIGVAFVVAAALTLYSGGYGLILIAGILFVAVVKFKNELFNKLAMALFGLIVVALLGLTSYFGVRAYSAGEYAWIKSISSPGSNRNSATAGVVWVSDRLQERAVDCVFDLSNNGVINGLIRRPSCSRFTYPVYAGSRHESILISDLQTAAPPALVYSSTYWSYSIDGKDMKMRFPRLDQFILRKYPKEECDFGYCVRYMED